MFVKALSRPLALASLAVTASLIFAACGITSADTSATETAGPEPPISTVSPAEGMSADGALALAQRALRSAESFDITQLTTREREDGSHSDEWTVRLGDEETAYFNSRRGEQITEVLRVPGHRYTRGYFIGQGGVRWNVSGGRGIAYIDIARGSLNDLEAPRLIGSRVRDGKKVYVLEGVAPVPVTWGGIGIWAEIEPETYTLEVDAQTLYPVRLTHSVVSWIVHDGFPTPESGTRTAVSVEFKSISEPVTVAPPPSSEIVQPDDPTATPDLRYPATPTPAPLSD